MCLVCGEMVCSQSYCCQTELEGVTSGAATAHARTCGAGTGMFLRFYRPISVHYCSQWVYLFNRVRDCQIVLLAGRNRGCFYQPPYLDAYGETDQLLRYLMKYFFEYLPLFSYYRRGNPLHLCQERYDKLHRLWIAHGIQEEVAHCLEANANLMNFEWSHM